MSSSYTAYASSRAAASTARSQSRQSITTSSSTISAASGRKRKHDYLDPDASSIPGEETSKPAAIPRNNAPVIDLTTPSPQSTPKKRRKTSTTTSPKAEKEEKRLRPLRKWAPKSYLLKLERARTQRLFVVSRQRSGTEEVPEENIDIVGATGNVYQVVIGKVPTCTCPDNRKGNQCKHIVYVLRNVLKAASHLQYQLAFLSSELRELFQSAPRNPADQASTENNEGKRKEISGDCPICFMEFEPAVEEIVWCKEGCGNNVHKTCFQQWMSAERGKEVRCVYCRTPWRADAPAHKDLLKQGYINDEGYLNVGDLMGMPVERDSSTYHQPWEHRRYSHYYYAP